jgi:hypothetical protein
MGSGHLVRPLFGAVIAASSACTLWAALDDPYKSDSVGMGPPADAGLDADSAPPPNRLIDAGFSPYAIAAMGDTVYVLDNQAQVHVAYDASTNFEPFWLNDAGETVSVQNRIAVSDAGVFWTINGGIRYCALDGGACGTLLRPATSPTAIAASDSMVAWIDSTMPYGIGRCSTPIDQCKPAPIPTIGNAPATSLAVTKDGTVAWVFAEQTNLRFDGTRGRSFVSLPQKADVVAADPATNNFYWVGAAGVGVVPANTLVPDAGYQGTYSQLTGNPPDELYAAGVDLYWTTPPGGAVTPMLASVYACRLDADGGCVARNLPGAFLSKRIAQGIAATSRQVLVVLTSPNSAPELLAWPNPNFPSGN